VLSDSAQFNTGEYVSVSNRNIDGESVREIQYSAPVVGPVSGTLDDSGEIVVLGQRVELSDLVVLKGIDSASELRIGDLVEISGYRVVDNRIVATRVSSLMQGSVDAPLRLTGFINTIDSSSSQFSINGASIDASTVDEESPDITELNLGDEVVVSAVLDTGATSLRALSVRRSIELNLGEPGDPALLAGAVTSYSSLQQPFNVRGFTVILTENSILDNGVIQRPVSSVSATETDPLRGLDEALVEGQINSQGAVTATRIIFAAAANRIDINGPIDGINVAQGSLSVNGIEVRVEDSTLFVDNAITDNPDLQLNDLSPGQSVLIRANRLDSLSAVARQIIRLN